MLSTLILHGWRMRASNAYQKRGLYQKYPANVSWWRVSRRNNIPWSLMFVVCAPLPDESRDASSACRERTFSWRPGNVNC